MEPQKSFNNNVKLSREKSSSLRDCIKIEEPTDSVKLYAGIAVEKRKSTSSLDGLNKRYITQERLTQIKKIVDEAIAQHKVFVIYGGFNTVRKALVARGWCEKSSSSSFRTDALYPNDGHPNLDDLFQNLPRPQEGESKEVHSRKCEKTIQFRLLQHHDANFYWNVKRDGCDWIRNIPKRALLNRFNRSLFTSKEGLCAILQQMHWHNEPNVAYTLFPRCYNTSFPEQLLAFIEDYRLTACMSLLKWFVHLYETEGVFAIRSCAGSLPLSTVDFALKRCNEFVAAARHEDLDVESFQVWEHEWENFLTNYYLFVHKKRRFLDLKQGSKDKLQESAIATLKQISECWPQFTIDGLSNIWIVKPGNKCRGRGIHLLNNYQDIINLVARHPVKKNRYVVQKYLEKPLLVHDTKFDIRQWFLVTSAQPLVLWMYRECYLRFSSQQFELNNFHESVHLTNHSVQCKYKNGTRNSALPDENMWDCHTFKTYLKQTGKEDKWEETIYPGMRQAIVGAMLASQENMDRRTNSFELFGADFMLGPDYMPWLLEINSSPDMAPTTSVTARLCPQCLEDIIKVTIDRRHNPTADTGMFDLIYKQACPRPTAYLGLNLTIRGRKLFQKKPVPLRDEFSDTIVQLCSEPRETSTPTEPSIYSGPIIADLIEELKAQVQTGDSGIQMIRAPENLKKRIHTVHHSKATVHFQPISKSVSLHSQKLTQKSLFSSQKSERKESDSTVTTKSNNKSHLYGYLPLKSKQNKPEKKPNSSNSSYGNMVNEWRNKAIIPPKTAPRLERHPTSYLHAQTTEPHEHRDISNAFKKKNQQRKFIQTLYHRGTKPHIPPHVLQNFLAVGLRLHAWENSELKTKLLPDCNVPKVLLPSSRNHIHNKIL